MERSGICQITVTHVRYYFVLTKNVSDKYQLYVLYNKNIYTDLLFELLPLLV